MKRLVATAARKWCRHGFAASPFGFVLVCLVGVANGQTPQSGTAEVTGLANGGFEELDAAGLPIGWGFPPARAGYQLTIDTANPSVGSHSAQLDSTGARQTRPFGSLVQTVDAEPYRGKRVRFRAAVRTAELVDDGRAQLWLRVDRVSNGGRPPMGAFDNMEDRPIRNDDWKPYEIVGQVDADAARIHVGLLLAGTGKAWIDDATLEVVPDSTPTTGVKRPVRNRPLTTVAAAPAKPQPFFVKWLALPVIAWVLFVLSQSRLGWAQRIAFRFSFAYWLLYSLPRPLTSVIRVFGYRMSMVYDSFTDKVVRWTAANVLGIKEALIAPNGSGDTTFDYIRILICFVLACGIAALWSAVDWRRTNHPWLNDLLRSYLRYVLAFAMLGYGLSKVGWSSNQFAEPLIEQLLKTYGDSSPMNLVWTFMGASRPYTIFAGLGEVAGGLLLIWRRTTILGAAVTCGVMLNVVMLNFCYDVPVKQYSAHLLMMAVYLLLPDLPRLANLLVWNRPADKVSFLPPYTGPKTIWVQRAFKAYLIAVGVAWPLGARIHQEYSAAGINRPEPAIYGSYEVDEFLVDGQAVPPLLTDNSRWRSLNLRRLPRGLRGARGPINYLTIRTMDGAPLGGQFAISGDEKTLTLMSGAGGAQMLPGRLTVEVLDDQHLALSGIANGQRIEVKLHKLKREDFLLINRGFHWISEYPFNL